MEEQRYTFLTGATGLVGQNLLVDLMRAGLPVVVLCRRNRLYSARERIERGLQRWEKFFGRTFLRPVILEGEFAGGELQLPREDRDWIRRYCGRVLHCAANVSFRPAESHPRREPLTTNVEGTRSLGRLMLDLGIREFHSISTAYVCGLRTGRIPESHGIESPQFANDYESSKWEAEKWLAECSGWDSLTIYRPSIVIERRSIPARQKDLTIQYAMNALELYSRQFGVPDVANVLDEVELSGEERKNLIPVDWLSRVIVQILRRPQLHGRIYHLTHPRGTPVRTFLESCCQALLSAGYRPSRTSPMGADRNQIHSGDTILARGEKNKSECISEGPDENAQSRVAEQNETFFQTFSPYFRDDPIFDQTELRAALEVCGEEPCPDVTGEILEHVARRQLRFSPRINENAELNGEPFSALPPGWRENIVLNEGSGNCGTLGLLLSGPGGGDWILQWDADGNATCAMGGAGRADSTLYMSAETWSSLARGEISSERAGNEGRLLLISSNETAAAIGNTFLHGLFPLRGGEFNANDLDGEACLHGS